MSRKKVRTFKDESGTQLLSRFRDIYEKGYTSDVDLNLFFRLHCAPCQGCRVNNKNSPSCFCGLAPPEGGSRRQGLWRKEADILGHLGEDPSRFIRASISEPIGLKNLGATCYVNTVLQCLYMIHEFRSGILGMEEQLMLGNPVLYQMAKLFAELQEGERSSVDPSEFARNLELDSGTQQDGAEFMKLLLTLLENALKDSQRPHVTHLVQSLFRGAYSYITRCLSCNRVSEGSSSISSFYELELNVHGLGSLQQSLDDFFAQDKLEGDNQYLCTFCGCKRDALRYIQLKNLPPVLNLQLKRFVFDYKTLVKKKVTSTFEFPLVIDLSTRLESTASGKNSGAGVARQGEVSSCLKPDAKSESTYELAAILQHKGSQATSGHYIAHVKDPKTGKWWQFDDEVVTCMGEKPFQRDNVSEVTMEQQSSITRSQIGEAPEDLGQIHSRAMEGAAHDFEEKVVLSSSDAYMLIYTRISGSIGDVANQNMSEEQQHLVQGEMVGPCCDEASVATEAEAGIQESTAHPGSSGGVSPDVCDVKDSLKSSLVAGENASHTAGLSHVCLEPIGSKSTDSHPIGPTPMGSNLTDSNSIGAKPTGSVSLPPLLAKEVAEGNSAFRMACQTYKMEAEAETERLEKRKAEVKRLLPSMSVGEALEGCWVATKWLKAWADDDKDPGPIENSTLLCSHGKVPHSKVPHMKRISMAAWSELVLNYGGGPHLSSTDCCQRCLLEEAAASQSSHSFQEERNLIRSLVERNLKGENLHGELFFVSKPWLHLWLRRKNADAPQESDANPTAALRCHHGSLLPETAPGAKRQVVSQVVWEYLVSVATSMAGEKNDGHTMFPATALPCTRCQTELTSLSQEMEGMRATKQDQRRRFDSIFNSVVPPLYHEAQVCMIPTSWVSFWHSFLTAKDSNYPPPPALQDALNKAICQEHQKLLHPPPRLALHKSQLVLKDTPDSSWTIISEDDWTDLSSEWGAARDAAIRARVQITAEKEKTAERPLGVRDTVGSLESCAVAVEKGMRESGGREVIVLASSGTRESGMETAESSGHQKSNLPMPKDRFGRKLHGENAADVAVLQSLPEPCTECIKKREAMEHASKASFKFQEIFVELGKEAEPTPSLMASNQKWATARIEDRRPKRTRWNAHGGGGRISLKVSGSTRVHELKLQIWESFEVVAENQRVGCGEIEFNDNNATLADLHVFPGSLLWVVNTKVHEDRDITEVLASKQVQYTEEGFRGTRLTSREPLVEEPL